MFLMIGALFGLLSVALGAYVEHVVSKNIDPAQLLMLTTAIRYQQLHAVVVGMIGMVQLTNQTGVKNKLINWGGYFFILGILLFSFGIYLVVIFHLPLLIKIVPWGGSTLMLGWLFLVVAGGRDVYLRRTKKDLH